MSTIQDEIDRIEDAKEVLAETGTTYGITEENDNLTSIAEKFSTFTSDFAVNTDKRLTDLENGRSVVATHSKTGNVHTLTTDNEVTGDIFSLLFKATAAFKTGDTVTYSENNYTVYTGAELATTGFVTDEVVFVNFDSEEQKAFLISGNGGSGNGVYEGLVVEYVISTNDNSDLTGSVLTVNMNGTDLDFNLTGSTHTERLTGLYPDRLLTATVTPKDGYIAPIIEDYTITELVTSKVINAQYIKNVVYLNLTITSDVETDLSNITITIKDSTNAEVYSEPFDSASSKQIELPPNSTYSVSFEDLENYITPSNVSITTGAVGSIINNSAEYVFDVAYFDLTLMADPTTDVGNVVITVLDSESNIISQDLYGDTVPKRYNLKSNTEYTISFGDLTSYPGKPSDYTFTTGGVKSYQSVSKTYDQHVIWGIMVDEDESDPYECVTYTDDAVGFTPVYQDYDNDVAVYGSWKSIIDEMARPCILNQDGTVFVYLDRENQGYDVDGNLVSTLAVTDDMNYMVEMKKLYHKRWEDGNKKYYQCSFTKFDDDAVCHMWEYEDGTEHDYFYAPMFKGNVTSSRMRSFPLLTNTGSTTGENEKIYAEANGDGYSLKPFVHWVHNCMMVYLLGKSLNSQEVFGNGRITGSSLVTGALIDKGAMCGYNTTIQQVKFLWQEGAWGDRWERVEGCISDIYDIKVKLHPPYNFASTGYDTLCTVPVSSASYIKNMTWNMLGIFPKVVGGSSATYYSDGAWATSGSNTALMVGGSYSQPDQSGISAWISGTPNSFAVNFFGASLYFKPPQITE